MDGAIDREMDSWGPTSGVADRLRRARLAPGLRQGRVAGLDRRLARGRTWLAVAVSLAGALALAASWTMPPAEPSPAPAAEARVAPLPGELAEGPVPLVSPAEKHSRDDAGGPPTAQSAEPEDPLLAALARLNPAGRIDDRTGGLPGWPIAVLDPERADDLAAAAPAGTSTPGVEVHVVGDGETLLGIALARGVSLERLAALNQLANPNRLAVGQRIAVPVGPGEVARAPITSRGATLRPRFVWPLTGPITTHFGERGAIWVGGHHTGLDIAGPIGPPVVAAEAGTVVEAGWAETRGFGNYVLIDHGVGYRTLYGHLSVIRVKAGQEVSRGELIGDVGSTGVSTGPHLHFEIRSVGEPVDPLPLLP